MEDTTIRILSGEQEIMHLQLLKINLFKKSLQSLISFFTFTDSNDVFTL